MSKKSLLSELPANSRIQINHYNDVLYQTIDSLVSIARTCCLNSQKDFTRNRKLPLKTVLLQLLTFHGSSLQTELFKLLPTEAMPATTSALIQQRNKIKPEAFDYLFSKFMGNFALHGTFKGYRLLACDGSVIQLPRNPADVNTSVVANPNAKSYNCEHLNAMYDLMNNVYLSYIFDDGLDVHEKDALVKMTACLPDPKHSIITADRGYGYYNTLFALESIGCHYVIRVKDFHSNSILTQLKLPDTEFDIKRKIKITRHKNKEYINDPNWVVLGSKSTFNFFDSDGFAEAEFRVIRFKLSSGEYECLLTDLPESEFDTETIKEIYAKRWGIETSFRLLKYSIDIVHLHSKKYSLIMQEIVAKLLMFNVYSLMVHTIPDRYLASGNIFRTNFNQAVGVLRDFILTGNSVLLNRLLYSQVMVREGRSVKRGNLHDTKPAKSFTYRAS